jgi:large subunit ribosomal protein L21
MYAIIADGGKQYSVRPGDTLYVETRELAEDVTTIKFDHVLLVGEGESTRIGTPRVEGVTVTARLIDRVRGPKENIVKFRRRKGYKLKKGHRQNYLKVTIDSIDA